MGFWHTGYIEFHEPVGLGEPAEPRPRLFQCKDCDEIYQTFEGLRQHRFESHPLRRPVLFLNGRELGAHPVRITRLLTEQDVLMDNCDQVFLNGKEISICNTYQELSRIRSDVCKLKLKKAGVIAEFTLEFCLAEEDDLKGVETQFEKMARGYKLDPRAVEDFISATEEFETAVSYTNGICEYLYGVLAKEKAPETTLPYAEYESKFNMAAESLSVYDRPLARTIGGLIGFHFNHFEETIRLAGETRVGKVARKYSAWLRGETDEIVLNLTHGQAEALVTDWGTERILRWSCMPDDCQVKHLDEIRSVLKPEIGEYDMVKIHILLGEIYWKLGDTDLALGHARMLRNMPASRKWAESMIRKHNERHNG